MTTFRDVRIWEDYFDRAQTFSTTPGQNGWTVADTSAAGAPTYLIANGRAATLTLASTSEAENVCLYHNDVLSFELANIQHFWFYLKGTADAVTTFFGGLGSARNDTVDSIATMAGFRVEGSGSLTNILVETDDTATDKDDVATGATLSSSAWKRCHIDFTYGLSDVRFYYDGERVAGTTTFDMSAASLTQRVQPIFQLQKASGTGVPAFSISGVRLQYKLVY